MLNFSPETTRRNTLNQFSTTFRRIFNPILVNGRKTKSEKISIGSNKQKPKLIEDNKNTKIFPISSNEIIVSNNVEPEIEKDCPICLMPLPENSKELNCGHVSCKDCLTKFFKIEISESRVNICCPECSVQIHPNLIQEYLKNDIHLLKYEEFIVRKVLITNPDTRWCPAPNCKYAVIATNRSKCPKIKCERKECQTIFCYNCQQEWKENHDCLNALKNKSKNKQNSYDDTDELNIDDSDIKQCPSCKISINKNEDGSCNHMTCSMCNTQFCWLCVKKASELHYLSPTGCTFFGKKPWSKRKKLFWQLGVLIGAPVGIALITGVAVPVIVIGVPIWFGKKLKKKLKGKKLSTLRKTFFISGGVLLSALISPIIAAGAIAIGIPFLLTYVYGIVPITLCRNQSSQSTSEDEPKSNLKNEKSNKIKVEFNKINDENNLNEISKNFLVSDDLSVLSYESCISKDIEIDKKETENVETKNTLKVVEVHCDYDGK